MVAVEEVANKVLSEPIRPQFAILSILWLYSLQEAHQLITAKLSSKVALIVNRCHGVIGRDALSDEFKEASWRSRPGTGIVLTVGFVPGLKVKPISLLRQNEPPQQGIDAVMEKLDFGVSSETVIVGDCSCGIEQTTKDVNDEDVDDEYGCGIQQTVAAVALVFVMDRNKPPGRTGETRFHAVLSRGLSPVGPTYKFRYDLRCIGVTKRRVRSSIGQEWMTSLSFHTIMEEEEENEFLVVDGMGIKTGDSYRFYGKDHDTSRSFNLLSSFKQRSINDNDNWEVCGGLIFTSRFRFEPNVAFLENFPGVTLGGTLCYKEIGRRSIGMLKRYHDIPSSSIKDETKPFTLLFPRVRKNLVFDTWRNVSFTPQVLQPGMILFKKYLTLMAQVDILNICQGGALGPGGFYQPSNESGDKLQLRMMCYGRNWDPTTGYVRRYRSDGSEPPLLPYEFISLAENAIQDAQSQTSEVELPSMCPDICVASFYEDLDQLDLHQDCDESSNSLRRGLPVVSISIGNTMQFVYGHTNNENKLDSVMLESGDVLIFGGKSRHIFHGVRKLHPDLGPSELYQQTGFRSGRLNLTLRQI
ncbi:hypothetical protein QVD17_02527 [Tagetes erecta]|uniref:Fe2OG dioxygenase domain-containing protein n=1 Tax=Tagetes erecta TaxID=13708 RepID=A0AAD8L6S1_TARER|nr:hypothetical protein QVD17_02527 [Tagetes erecta]